MKHRIRKEILAIRDGHEHDHLLERSLAIKKNLFSLPEFKSAKAVMFYVSAKGEVKTGQMIREALKLGKKVIVPAVDRGKHEIEACEIESAEELSAGEFGIPEPKKGCRKHVDPCEIEVIIVPGIAFDRKGYRVGHGFGFYDKFMSSVRHPKKIGLAYDFQLVDEIPKEEHDVSVDIIVTEKGVIKIGKSGF